MSSKNNKYNAVPKVSEEKIPTWDDLMETNLELRKVMEETGRKLNDVYVILEKDLAGDADIFKTFNGVNKAYGDIVNSFNELTKAHSVEVDNGGKKALRFNAGKLDITNSTHSNLFINIVTAYNSINEDLSTFVNTSVATVMSEYEEKMSKKDTKVKG